MDIMRVMQSFRFCHKTLGVMSPFHFCLRGQGLRTRSVVKLSRKKISELTKNTRKFLFTQ